MSQMHVCLRDMGEKKWYRECKCIWKGPAQDQIYLQVNLETYHWNLLVGLLSSVSYPHAFCADPNPNQSKSQ
jgi:hypothetical protein